MTSYRTFQDSEPPTGSDVTEEHVRTSFNRMTICFSAVHAVCSVPLLVATTLLGPSAFIGNGIFYLASIIGALFVAVPITARLGLRGALIAGSLLYSTYLLGFSLALGVETAFVQELIWDVFSVSGGLAHSILWTAQGGYFTATASKLAPSGTPRSAVTARLSGNFAFWLLFIEVLAKLGFTVLQALSLRPAIIGLLYVVISLVFVNELRNLRAWTFQKQGKSTAERVLGVASLWGDPLLWLLSPINLTYGFSTAFMLGYINMEVLSEELGPKVVASAGALTLLVAAISGAFFGSVTRKWWVMNFGALSFLGVPLCLQILGCCHGWGRSMLWLYVFQGLGRAVFESTNRAVFADFFPGVATQNAFANTALQSQAAFACSFFLQTKLSRECLARVIMCMAGATPVCCAAASMLQPRRKVWEATDGDAESVKDEEGIQSPTQ